jgi:dTDP-4-amino-4,6-dideoxygalactose transaminase
MSAREAAEQAEARLAAELGVSGVVLASSGRAGLTLLLQLLREEAPERNEVVLPAFGCFTLPSAAVRAGLRIRVVDLAPESFELDLQALGPLLGPRTLALVAPHLLGHPLDIPALAQAAESAGAFLIDDAAQALGARRDGQRAGSGGVGGILSFGRGKPLSAMGGGAILIGDSARAARLARLAATLPPAPEGRRIRQAGLTAAGSLALIPELYALAARAPWLRLGITEYDPSFPLARLDSFRSALVGLGLPRLSAVNAARRRHAALWRQGLAGNSAYPLLSVPVGAEPIELRLPVLAASARDRERALAALRRAGIGASRLYPAPLTAIPALARHSPEADRSFPQATALAERLLCLPTYPYLDSARIAAGVTILAELGKRAIAERGR